jgi:hypothetical protein
MRPKTRRIILENTHLIAVGPYLKDVEYDVPEEQATHLVAHRGFRFVDAAPPAKPPTEEMNHG